MRYQRLCEMSRTELDAILKPGTVLSYEDQQNMWRTWTITALETDRWGTFAKLEGYFAHTTLNTDAGFQHGWRLFKTGDES